MPKRPSQRRPPRAPAKPTRTKRQKPQPSTQSPGSLERTAIVRNLFWQNVLRELLMSLAALSSHAPARPRPAPDIALAYSPLIQVDDHPESDDPDIEDARAQGPTPPPAADAGAAALAQGTPDFSSIFDGRIAIITQAGQRIPIAEVRPLFAVGVLGSRRSAWLSAAVEATVFEIRTPGGEVFTLPLQEIRAVHSLSEDLMSQIENSSRSASNPEDRPFGFAAFTSLARAEDAGPKTDWPAGHDEGWTE